MNTKEFDKKYRDKGGIFMLKHMRERLTPLKIIAHHFSVSRERVRQWMQELFGEKYDPRPARREKAVQDMIDFYNKTSLQEFRKAYHGSAYYRKALEIINRG